MTIRQKAFATLSVEWHRCRVYLCIRAIVINASVFVSFGLCSAKLALSRTILALGLRRTNSNPKLDTWGIPFLATRGSTLLNRHCSLSAYSSRQMHSLAVAYVSMVPRVTPTRASGTLRLKPRELGMVFKFIRPFLEGIDDAKAAIAQPQFLAAMASIERLSPDSQDLIASAFLHAMEGIAKQARATLPDHCHQDYINYFMDSARLQLVAEHYFSQARIHKPSADLIAKGAGLALELVGYYLLSRSWQDFDHTISIDAPGLGAKIVGREIENRIHAFLKNQGRSLPRSC